MLVSRARTGNRLCRRGGTRLPRRRRRRGRFLRRLWRHGTESGLDPQPRRGTLAFAACAAVLQAAAPPLWVLAIIVYAALAAALMLMPSLAGGRAQLPEPPAWDLPARMAVATVLVLVLTEVAPLLGRG
jgi:hypothetical protein